MKRHDPDPVGLLSGERQRIERPPLRFSLAAGQSWTDSRGRPFQGPAVLYRFKGDLHREDGPAYIGANGNKEWWINGKLHREGAPAVEYANGHRAWYLHGKLHRDDGPAEIFADGTQHWVQHGLRDRQDGPAYIGADGKELWYRNGNRVFQPGSRTLEPVEDTPERREARARFLERSKTGKGIDFEALEEVNQTGWC